MRLHCPSDGFQGNLFLSFLKMSDQSSLISHRIVALCLIDELPLCDFPLSCLLVTGQPIIFIHNNIIMRRASKSNHLKNDSTLNTSQALLPPTLPLKFKGTRNNTQRSLSDSIVSTRSQGTSFRFKLPNSFYNDHSNIYESKSRMLLEKNRSFQSRPISYSQRKRYESDSIEKIASKHHQLRSLENTPQSASDPTKRESNREQAKKRFQDVMTNKYKRLVHGSSMIKVGKQLLQQSVKRTLSEKSTRKWKSPFTTTSVRDKFKGEQLVPKRIEKLYGNTDATQLKVLNLDRLFRVKNGQLSNVVPLPTVKLNQVSARSNVIKAVLNKDRIHDVIKEYNSLLRLMKLKQTAPRLGVKGKTFTKSPTIEELMGIKLNPTKAQMYSTDQLLSQDVFTNHSEFYQQNLKKDVHLTRRLISGLCQQQTKGISLAAFTRFYSLFVNKIASIQEKSNFLAYFFVPEGESNIQFEVLKLILELMCQELPAIDKLNLKTDLLSRQEKSKIFLQALNRVLFGEIELDFKQKGLSRELLRIIFHNNPDATDLLLRLVQLQ